MYDLFQTIETRVHVGLEKPVRLLQLTDMHVTLADETDSEYAREQQGERRYVFRWDRSLPRSEDMFEEWLRRADAEGCDCLLLTGDTIDAPSHGNLAYLASRLAGHEYLYVVGNHDWCFPVDGKRPADEVRAEFFPGIEAACGQSLYFYEKKVGGVTLIGLDDSRSSVTADQAARTFAVLDRGEPTILCCHIPLWCETLEEPVVNYWKSCGLCGKPGCNEVTRAFVEKLRTYPNLILIVAGDIHFNHEDVFSPYTRQVTTQTAVHPPIAERYGKEVPHGPGQARWIIVD